MAGVVERFLAAMAAHDWATMAACVTPDVERTGPFGDVYRGREPYVELIAGLLPTLAGYRMEVARVVYSGDAAVAVAELTETVELDGKEVVTAEGLVFDLDGDLIRRISIYLRHESGPGAAGLS